ncbi:MULTISPECIES: DUF2839 domain-containing protein [Prochlorococcus]|uniref:DUF2839 domain-containing protein n=1 Tax=Prochlorococcus TaxID=1218 RepID=UPI000533A3B7|nr:MULTISPECIES: DUF2839 domain-containing protein [Prochlorococcus]KGG13586.1 hypothetical protein EV05_0242 [Prochlorococcus sp. MIT 0601]
MGEARRRTAQGLPPRPKKKNNDSQKIFSWLPVTDKQRNQFIDLTIRGGWVGIGALVLVWVIVRVIGPAFGWWIPADLH